MSKSNAFLRAMVALVILPMACEAAELVNGDFETGTLVGWSASGTAFATSPLDTDPGPGWQNWQGNYYVNSWGTPEKWAAIGRLRSASFILEGGGVRFLVSAWGSPKCYVTLNDAATGAELDRFGAPLKGNLGFYPACLYAPGYRGKEVFVEIVDNGRGRNDWICVDEFGNVTYDPDKPPFAIDITGDWHEGDAYDDGIQVREPALADGEKRRFSQRLTLPAGDHAVELTYVPVLDKAPGHALGGGYNDFNGLSINGESVSLDFVPDREDESVMTARREFHVEAESEPVELSLELENTRVMRTRLLCGTALPISDSFAALPCQGKGLRAVIHGVPFLLSDMTWFRSALAEGADHAALGRWDDGLSFDCHGAKVKTAYFLGMLHNIDLGNGSWYVPKGDHGFNHFVGDKAGGFVIRYADGTEEEAPIVWGYNLWWSRPWDIMWHYNWGGPGPGANMDDILFGGEDGPRQLVRDAVGLVDGVRIMGSESCNARFIFALDLGGRAVESIAVRGEEAYYDFPLISAITLRTANSAKGLIPLPALCPEAPNIRAYTPQQARARAKGPEVDALMHEFYTFTDELPALREPEVPEGYFGPRYDFRGAQDAIYVATYLYRNGPECGSHIPDTGITCTSPVSAGKIAQYCDGTGVWFMNTPWFTSLPNWFKLYKTRAPGDLPGQNAGWTRGIAPLFREAEAFGYDKFIEQYLDWLDHDLLTNSNPPHWGRVAGSNHASYEVPVGDIVERGNRENDGHGMCMWARYLVWHWKGEPEDWNRRRWEATKAAGDWIGWQLDTDQIRPGVEKDVLYTESECAHGSYDIYSSYNCLYGLKLSIRMAEQLGEEEVAERWRADYKRLRQGILDHLVDDSEFGPIWHTDPHCDWQDHAHKMVHIQVASDGDTYTPLQDYARGDAMNRRYLEISCNSYRYLMRDKNYNCLRMYGYGQGYMAQAALLLDQMEDAEHFVDMLVRHCYLPNFAGWACPEGIILHRSGKYYLPVNGYWGQDVHLAESTKALRIMLGIDDNNARHLRFVPRYPLSWDRMEVDDFPVLTGKSRQKCGYTYERKESSQIFMYRFERPVAKFSVRLGPLPEGAHIADARLDGRKVTYREEASGDSRWVWVEGLEGTQGTLVAELQ